MSQYVLGIDIGWSEKKQTTGICLLSWDKRQASFDSYRVGAGCGMLIHDVRRKIGRADLRAVAIDGPLRPGFDEIGEYRDAEMLLTRGFQVIGKPSQSSSLNGRKLNRVANEFAQALLDGEIVARSEHRAAICERAIVEAFPTSFLGVMLEEGRYPAAGMRSDMYFEHLLGPDSPRPDFPATNRLVELVQRLIPDVVQIQTNLADVTHHEDRAAVVCAISALCVATRRFVAVGDPRNGYIILPPVAEDGGPGLQLWAWNILQRNQPRDNAESIIIEPETK